MITANPSDFAKLTKGISEKYNQVKIQSDAKIKKCEESMPVLYDKQWYENVADGIKTGAVSVASGVEGVAISAVRDAIEGVTAPILLATELVK